MALAVLLRGALFGLAGTSLTAARSTLPRSRVVRGVATEPALASAAVARDPASHPAFELVRVEMVDEYLLKCATYKHKKSGAEVISAQADDDNKVFGIVFRTPVSDDTGVPHILEHSVLCGSEKYTSKEPFAELLKGSLQTFLNAFTYPDRTCYPVASQNTADFYNLVNVYLDAVLNPRAKSDATVLQQEGWHYELDDPAEPLTYKGVVYNEMKGVYSSPESLLYRAAQQTTFPDNTYASDSGGDPSAITSLSFEQFKSFHDAYYHPANSRVYFYGDDDPYKRLELLDSYLSKFDAPPTPPASGIVTQRMLTAPRRQAVPFPAPQAAEGEKAKHLVMVNWLMNEAPFSDVDELAVGVLDHLLMGTRTSVLYKAMMDSGLGEAIVGGGVSDELKQMTFSVGLKGVAKEDVGKVEDIAIKTLADVARNGFEQEAIDASLNTVEFDLREMNTGGFPKGLAFMLALLPRWIYRDDDGSPADSLRFEQPLAELKRRLSGGEKVFEDLLARCIVGNAHRNTVEMVPDETLAERLISEENAKLAAAKAAMGDEDVRQVIENTATLRTAQLAEDSAEDLATIPRVGVADLDRTVKQIPTDQACLVGGGTLLTHALPTGGVVYADIVFDLATLPASELPLIPLMTALMLETGTSDLDAVTLQRRIGAKTGGIRVSPLGIQKVPADGSIAEPMDAMYMLAMRGKGTKEKVDDLFDLMYSVVSDANLDAQSKVIEVLRESKAQLESNFVRSGNMYAGMRLGSRNSLLGHINEVTSGVSYYETVRSLLATATDDWPALKSRLEKLRDTILVQKDLTINLTTDPAAIATASAAADAFAARVPAARPESAHGPSAAWKDEIVLGERTDEAFAITTQVNYVAAGAKLFEHGEACRMGAFDVVSRFLSQGYLWDNVRVAGGAYGGGCSLNPVSGAFAFSSYRDPNLQDTLDIYGKAVEQLDALELTDEALEQSIVGAIGSLDSPLTADAKGYRALQWHLSGMTTEFRQAFRDQVLTTSRADFADFAERLRGAKLAASVFASADAIEKANAKRAEDAQLPVKPLA